MPFEIYTSNIYIKGVLSDEFIVANKHLLKDLVERDLWTDEVKDTIMRAKGSVQNIDIIPDDIKELYKTVWELSMKDIIDMSRQRGYFINQSQLLNLFMEGATFAKLTSMHFYASKSGLKTSMYYLRTKSAVDAIKFTLGKEQKKQDLPKAQTTDKIAEANAERLRQHEAKSKTLIAPENSSLSPEELKTLIKQSKESEGDDCLMCGS